MNPKVFAADIPLYTGLDAADATANPFFAGDSVVRSLNRARLVAAQGVPPEWYGRTAGELLSARALADLAREAAGALHLDPDAPDLLRALDQRFDSPPALAIAREAGRRLGAFLLMLHRGDAISRAARPDWGDAHWAFWATVERVVVGGGLFAGRLGEAAVPAANEWLAGAGCPVAVERSPYGDAVALVGLARHAPPDATRMILFDFGQTAVKRGAAVYREGAVVEFTRFPALPAPDLMVDGDPATSTRAHWAAMRELIVACWRSVVATEAARQTAVGLSIATHLRDGHPFVTDHGPYSRLGILAPHLATFMRDDLAAALGSWRSFALLHDGLAAASTRAGERRTVVLVLGTGIGAGYVPVGTGLREMRFG